MGRNPHIHSARPFSDRRWILPFLSSLLISILIFLMSLLVFSPSNASQLNPLLAVETPPGPSNLTVESEPKRSIPVNESMDAEVPRLAYLISGTKGDTQRMMRTLDAVYHPRNHYILHLDFEAPPRERLDLAMSVKGDPVFREFENVRVMAQSNLVTYKGPTMIATTLQAVAIMLREKQLSWDWFINLSASDYPLVTQDDLLYVLSNVSRNLNFIEHTQISEWKMNHRAKRIIIDPGLYLSKKSDIFWATQTRTLPTSFRLFTGSAWVMLTRAFLEYCTLGWDNTPRTMLLYYSNFVSSPEGYFHTVICNSQFRDTARSHDLHYIAWDNPPKQHPMMLSINHFNSMLEAGTPFARKFAKDDPVLDKIDKEVLGRPSRFSPVLSKIHTSEGASPVRPGISLLPTPSTERLQRFFHNLTSSAFPTKPCLDI